MSITELGLLMREEPLRHDEVQLILGSGHRHVEQPTLSSSISSGVPVARSEGMHPSTAFKIRTMRHSWPLAEWIVERTV